MLIQTVNYIEPETVSTCQMKELRLLKAVGF